MAAGTWCLPLLLHVHQSAVNTLPREMSPWKPGSSHDGSLDQRPFKGEARQEPALVF